MCIRDRESTALNDTDMKYLLLYLEETYGLTNEKKIDNAIGIVANENKYHPIRDYLPMTTQESTEYDLLGRMTSSTDVLGRVTTYALSLIHI